MSNEDLAKNLAQALRMDWRLVFSSVRTAATVEGRTEEEVWSDVGEIRMILFKKFPVNVARNWFEQVKYYCGNERKTGYEMFLDGHIARLLEIVKSARF